MKYTYDLNIPVEDVFMERQKLDKQRGLVLNSALINFANIGNSTFEAQRIFHLRKGETYKINWYYGLRVTGGVTATIDFNEKVKTADSSRDNVLKPYTNTIVADQDQDYVLTIK